MNDIPRRSRLDLNHPAELRDVRRAKELAQLLHTKAEEFESPGIQLAMRKSADQIWAIAKAIEISENTED